MALRRVAHALVACRVEIRLDALFRSSVLYLALATRVQAQKVASNFHVQGFQLSPEKFTRAVAYRQEGYWLYFATTIYTLLLLWAILRLRIAPRLRNWAERVSTQPWIQLALFAPPLLLLFALLLLPTDVYEQWHSRKYGISVEGCGAWLMDWSGIQVATILAGTALVGLLYFFIRRSPRRWWLYLWLVGMPITAFVVFVQPVLIDPIFNSFEPLGKTHPDLLAVTEKLLARASLEIPPEHIYLSKASEKTTASDASSEGFGPTKSIFIDDTIIASESRAGILHTVGHEIGHFMLPLDRISLVVAAPLLLALLFLIHRVFAWAIARNNQKWEIRGPQDWASFPVLALIIFFLTIVLTPASNALSRAREHEADRFGLELIHGIVPNGGEAAAEAFQKDGEANLADPAPPAWIRWWLYDHPPVNERIIFCRTYDPWSRGLQPKYVK